MSSEESLVLVSTNSNPNNDGNNCKNTELSDLESKMESMLTKFSEQIEIKFERVQKQLVRLEAKMTYLKPLETLTKSEYSGDTVDFDGTLRLLGLPLKTIIDIDDFEYNLKTTSFEQKMVIVISSNNMVMMIYFLILAFIFCFAFFSWIV